MKQEIRIKHNSDVNYIRAIIGVLYSFGYKPYINPKSKRKDDSMEATIEYSISVMDGWQYIFLDVDDHVTLLNSYSRGILAKDLNSLVKIIIERIDNDNTIKINDQYTAIVHKDHIEVGCQKITKEKFIELKVLTEKIWDK